MRTGKSRAGIFTLVELLVVIAVISILAALLLPALNKAKDNAQRILCLSNMKQTNLVLQGYAADSNGWFPRIETESPHNFVNAVGTSSGPWMEDYFCKGVPAKSAAGRILYCPSFDKSIIKPGGWWGYDPANVYFWTTYWFVVGQGNWGPGGDRFYGRLIWHVAGGANGLWRLLPEPQLLRQDHLRLRGPERLLRPNRRGRALPAAGDD